MIGCIPRQPRLKNSFGDFLHTLRGKKEKDVARHVALEGLFPRSEPKECSDSDHEVAELPTLQDGITYKNAHPSTVRGVGKGCSALFDPQGPRKIHIIDGPCKTFHQRAFKLTDYVKHYPMTLPQIRNVPYIRETPSDNQI